MEDEQYKELMKAIVHIHGHVEACITKIDEVERKVIMSNNNVFFRHMERAFNDLELNTQDDMNQSNDDLIAGIESYSPINEEDAKEHESRLKKIDMHANCFTQM